MVNYNCPRCGYSNNIRTKYVNHLRRKKLCEPKIINNNLDEEYRKYNIVDKICKISKKEESIKSQPKVNQNSIKSQPKVNQKSTKTQYMCDFCDKKLSYKQSYHVHLKRCKKKLASEKSDMLELVNLLNERINQQQKELEKRDKELEKRDRQIDELIKKVGIVTTSNITNNIQQNIQQNIKLLAYKDTDLSHLTDSDYIKCLNHSNFCIPHLIEKIHFDPSKPENHNIYISNLKNNYVMVYDGDKWTIRDREESIQNLIDDKEYMIEQKLEEWIENGDKYPDIMKKFNRYIDKKENDRVLNKIKNEIRLMLFNNRNIISIK